MKHDSTEHSIPKEVITYAAGAVEARISEIARNSNQPEQELRKWVAVFLLSSWEGLSNNLPSLRRSSTKIYPSTRKMAMVNNSHPQSSQSASNSSHPVDGRAPSTQKGYKYPKGTHWTQRPENKAKLARVSKLRHAKKAA